MTTTEIVMTILGVGGFTGVSMAFVLKQFLKTSIKESIGSIYKKQLETHKFLLKNSEKVFQYKLDASKALFKIFYEIAPERTTPDMDIHDAFEQIASSFPSHEKALDEFLCEYQATLSPKILERVRSAISACSDGKFEYYWDNRNDEPVTSRTAIQKAEELYQALSDATEELREELHEMISSPAS